MYKKLIPALLLIGGSTASMAQSTLTAANFNPQIWNVFVNVICDPNGVTEGASGANVTWDFSTPGLLVASSIDSGQVDPCSATPHCSLFPGSNYAIVSHATKLIPYYIENTGSLSQNGYYLSADTFASYSNPIDMFHYPFTYGTTFSDPYAGTLHYGPGPTANETGTITVNCDGYGTLKLPPVPGFTSITTFSNVLRVHTTQAFTDSLSLFGLPVVGTFTLETYSWYMPNYHSALMTILYSTGPTGSGLNNKAVSVAPLQIDVLTPTIPGISASLELFPNPVKDELNVKYNTATNENVRVTLSDLLGREIAVISDRNTQGTQQLSYNTSNLPKGLYLIRLQSGTETVTRKIEIM